MTLLTAARRVALECGLEVMDSLMMADRTAQEMLAIADDVAVRITESHDWTMLARTFEIPVGTDEFALPSDFDRFRQDAELFDGFGRRLDRVTSPEQRLGRPFVTNGGWWLEGGSIYLTTPGGVSGTYQSANRILSVDGPRQTFDKDTDQFILGDRLLELGMVWRWKASRGLPYGQEYDEFERAMTLARGRDGQRETITVGRRSLPPGVSLAWPGTIIPPDPVVPNPDPTPDPDPGGGGGVWDDSGTWSD